MFKPIHALSLVVGLINSFVNCVRINERITLVSSKEQPDKDVFEKLKGNTGKVSYTFSGTTPANSDTNQKITHAAIIKVDVTHKKKEDMYTLSKDDDKLITLCINSKDLTEQQFFECVGNRQEPYGYTAPGYIWSIYNYGREADLGTIPSYELYAGMLKVLMLSGDTEAEVMDLLRALIKELAIIGKVDELLVKTLYEMYLFAKGSYDTYDEFVDDINRLSSTLLMHPGVYYLMNSNLDN